ncbi:MAG TPA: tRNA epoxyqueuosine(34) reductase QueG [Gemmatimonadota bacterium]|nr:tRNA epoxyqueuosine(34) reductase QueG [Gemmatimonadota bacterium]
MTPAELSRRVKDAARELGFDLVGIARADAVDEADLLAEWLSLGRHGTMGWMERWRDKRVDPRLLVDGCRSIVSVGLVYYRPDRDAPQPPGTKVARYAWGEDYHRVLKDKLHALLARGRALDPAFEGRAFTDSGPVMERWWAERTGLGWRGKNTLLLNKRLGSFLFLGELLVRAELEPDAAGIDHCGTCTRCIDACPTGAIVAPRELDARRCISYWTIEHRGELPAEAEESVGGWLFGCDVCQDVCPWNRDAPETREERLRARSGDWPPALDDLLVVDGEGFDARFGETAIERARRSGLARNAAIVAGNTGLGSRQALETAAEDADPTVAATARRALARREEVRSFGSTRAGSTVSSRA